MADAEPAELFLIDSDDVLIDVIHQDPKWMDWSAAAIGDCLNLHGSTQCRGGIP
ncbi:hypothetical protein QTH90_08295 [Variovorax sp. J2P1-59]|uniref:hypothetical protein n=1 Tax=Variovorax flavidus TaxID=3053501 RepID=UPI002577DEA6|nr:hypothetical protein [Variovorax sp. J2P1-59]MDM0074377.1 hypothetical protein [Variovorax sp. J2P1-59]